MYDDEENDEGQAENGPKKAKKSKEPEPKFDRRLDLTTPDGVVTAAEELLDGYRIGRVKANDAAALSKVLAVALGAHAVKLRAQPVGGRGPVPGAAGSTPFQVTQRGQPVRLLPPPDVGDEELTVIRSEEPAPVRVGTPPPMLKFGR